MDEQDGGSVAGKTRRTSAQGVPRWVKLFGVAALLGIAAFLALHLTGLAPNSHQM